MKTPDSESPCSKPEAGAIAHIHERSARHDRGVRVGTLLPHGNASVGMWLLYRAFSATAAAVGRNGPPPWHGRHAAPRKCCGGDDPGPQSGCDPVCGINDVG